VAPRAAAPARDKRPARKHGRELALSEPAACPDPQMFKQVLGWTAPKIRDPAAADRWTWLIIAVYAQLRLARPLAADLRRPWERPAPPGRLTPARVRRGFRNVRAKTVQPASAPETGQTRPWQTARLEEPSPGATP